MTWENNKLKLKHEIRRYESYEWTWERISSIKKIRYEDMNHNNRLKLKKIK